MAGSRYSSIAEVQKIVAAIVANLNLLKINSKKRKKEDKIFVQYTSRPIISPFNFFNALVEAIHAFKFPFRLWNTELDKLQATEVNCKVYTGINLNHTCGISIRM
jgi:hypothetical protein